MRMSLLQQREPFGAILEQTLASFCQQVLQRPSLVRWHDHATPNVTPADAGQIWLCNPYLNAIFVPQADRAVFDPIRREFARSIVAWRRLAQRAYVQFSLSRAGAPLIAQSRLSIAPGLPDAEQLLIIPGNHKIRVLDYGRHSVYGILKQGFDRDFMQREIETRRLAEQLGLPVPMLEQVAPDASWFKERYLSATPLNRLADATVRLASERTAMGELQRLLRATACEEPLDEYVARCAAGVRALIAGSTLLTLAQRQKLLAGVERMQGLFGTQPEVMGRIVTAVTHGDFQPGNILLNQDGIWLIDWEYSARRQSGYDALVFMLGSRSVVGLAQRISGLLRADLDQQYEALGAWPGVRWHDRAARRIYLTIFLLEELALHLQENANPVFRRPGQGLLNLEQELWPALQAVSA